MTLVDTAEAYGGGGAERLVGDAIRDRRDEVFVVTKVLPDHADRTGAVLACERSLQRLRTDHIDLYLLHWRGLVPLTETVEAFTRLQEAGKIRNWGVSNFDTDDLAELTSVAGGQRLQTDQVLHNLARRGVEWDLLPMCQNAKLPLMAYSPFDHGGTILRHAAVQEVARRHDATPAQVGLAWVLRQDGVNTIPKASTPRHTRENRGALDLELTSEDLTTLDRAFPPPNGPRPLQIL